MIRRVLSLLVALGGGAARAQEPEPADEVVPEDEQDDLARYRRRFDLLADRAIGTTSVPVEFNWRRTTVQIAAQGSYLVELNNFNSLRAGALARVPSGGVLLEGGVGWTAVWDSPSSEALAFTPYRQPGRPDRLEVDLAVGFPLAEGVVTTFPKFFPAAQMVLVGYAGFRYSVYPTGFPGMRAGEVLEALISPALTETEVFNLDDDRLDAMQIDPGRYGFWVALGNDIYFKSGFFLSPRLTVGVPLLAPISETDLLVWSDATLALGVAF